ncbi:MAG: 50S ribosomal protein L18 [Candidatus Aenigmarchaeota archaeon]|nr:50S ribosomal protein L18 [Candidatus Aenigmarchaeota archaeon]
MKKSYLIHFKRRRKKKTNYKKRLAFLKSGKTRIVIRKSLSNISIQFINFKTKSDETIASANSIELKKMGWSKTGNIPAAYLTGLLAGKKARDKKIEEAILDLGVQTSTKSSRLYAALKGVLDSGIKVPHSEDILPKEDRIRGKHISGEIEKQFEDIKNKIVG